MSGKKFFDTNVLVYAATNNDTRALSAQAFLAEGGSISVQVLNEFANTARRKLERSWPEVIDALAALRVLCTECLPITEQTHDSATRIAQVLGYSFHDSLIIASALEANCTTLLTEDMQCGQVIDGRLTIQNPFRNSV
jgi:predicted nucleic acid-binding protein